MTAEVALEQLVRATKAQMPEIDVRGKLIDAWDLRYCPGMLGNRFELRLRPTDLGPLAVSVNDLSSATSWMHSPTEPGSMWTSTTSTGSLAWKQARRPWTLSKPTCLHVLQKLLALQSVGELINIAGGRIVQ